MWIDRGGGGGGGRETEIHLQVRVFVLIMMHCYFYCLFYFIVQNLVNTGIITSTTKINVLSHIYFDDGIVLYPGFIRNYLD